MKKLLVGAAAFGCRRGPSGADKTEIPAQTPHTSLHLQHFPDPALRRSKRKEINVVVRWHLLRRDLRGSGATIIALLGESKHEAHAFKGSGRSDSLEYSDVTVYFKEGICHG